MAYLRAFLTFAAILATASVGVATIIHVPGDQPTIQEGIDVANVGDTVLVADGTFAGDGNKNLDFDGKSIVVKSENGYMHTIIDCENDGRAFYLHSGEGQDTIAVIEGFNIIHGNAYNGGAIWIQYSSPLILNCSLSNNTATRNGGGISIHTGNVTIRGCLISQNSAGSEGGGIASGYTSLTIGYTEITGNSASKGGGMFLWGGSCPEILNATIADNEANSGNGGGIQGESGAVFEDVRNCIVWNNQPVQIQSGNINVYYSDVEGGWEGEGNIDEDPFFIGGDPFEYHLTEDSPCIDAGDPESPLDPDSTRADMGAYYFDQSVQQVLSLSVDPDTTYYHRGDILGFTVTVTNNTDSILFFQGWTEGETPWGLILSPLLGPINVVLGAQQTVSPHINQQIPRNTPYGGPYIYTVLAGEHPDSVYAEDSFEFFIVPGLPGQVQIRQQYEDWEVIEGREW